MYSTLRGRLNRILTSSFILTALYMVLEKDSPAAATAMELVYQWTHSYAKTMLIHRYSPTWRHCSKLLDWR